MPDWDGVSDFYEDDEPIDQVLMITEREPNIITRRPCLICLAKADEHGQCGEWEGHTVDEQIRVVRERSELERTHFTGGP